MALLSQLIANCLKKKPLASFALIMQLSLVVARTPAFIENQGQVVNQLNETNQDVRFLFAGKGLSVQLRSTGYSYEFFSYRNLPPQHFGNNRLTDAELAQVSMQSSRVDIDFANMNNNTEIIAEEANGELLNYYTNGKEILNIRSFKKVTYKNIYNNVDIEFIISADTHNPLKYNILLHPGADLKAIQFLVKGADPVITAEAMQLGTPLGMVRERIPASYYANAPSANHPVRFNLNKAVISFSSDYDNSREFIIDPSSSLIWSTYYGGSATDYCTSVDVDGQNNVYFAGHTFSTNNIATSGAYQSTLSGSLDAFVCKLDAGGNRLWASYFGGNSVEQIFSIYVMPDGTVYLSGDTFSTSNIATAGAFQTTYGGGIDDAILLKFSSSGQRIWSTYFGGDEHDISQGVTVDRQGNVIMTGHTQSANMATPGAYSTAYSFNYDVYVAKFDSSGNRLWTTYYGDSGVDEAYGVTTDPSNNIYVTGTTASIAGIATSGCHQPALVGTVDAFIAKFSAAGTSLLWGTYFGGSGPGSEQGNAIKCGYGGNVFIVGTTTSSNNIITPNAYQSVMGSSDDAFVTCFSQAGVQLWGTYFGGDNTDYINGLTIDANKNLLFCGQTLSTNSISTSGAYQSTLGAINNYDAFFEKFSYSGAQKLGTYFGSADNDLAHGIAVDNTGKVYIAGETTSTVGIANAAAQQTVFGGNQDGFVAKFCTDIEPVITATGGNTLCIGNNTLTATSGYLTYLWSDGTSANPLVTSNTTAQGTYQFTVSVTDGFGCSGTSAALSIVISNCYVSLSEAAQQQQINLYPVPAGNIINLELKDLPQEAPVRIRLYNAEGQLLDDCELKGSVFARNIQHLPAGIYILRADSKGKEWNKKFIKE